MDFSTDKQWEQLVLNYTTWRMEAARCSTITQKGFTTNNVVIAADDDNEYDGQFTSNPRQLRKYHVHITY